MRKELIVSTIPQETRVAVLEDDELVEFLIERNRSQSIAGNIYKGRVTKVLPGMQSAFVDIGLQRDAFLYVSDFLEDMDEYDRIVSTAEDEALKNNDSPRRSTSGRTVRTGRPSKTEIPKGRAKEKPGDAVPSQAASPDSTVAGEEASGSDRTPTRPGPKRPETKGPERAGPKARPDRRDRKPRVPSFASRSEQPRHGTLDLLPGESLAKYRDQTGPRENESLVEAELEQIIDETEERHILEKYPQEARMVFADQEKVEISEASAGKSAEEVETDQQEPEAALPDGPQSESPRAGSIADEDLPDANTQDRKPESGEKRQARISDRPKSGKFSRTPPARRPRRRSSAKPDTGRTVSLSDSPTISELLKEGQEIVVQVSKEPLGKKGARITSHVALPGRYLVYMPTVDHIGVSRKISSEDERARLRKIISENRNGLPGGFIVRTASEGLDEKEFVQDLRFLGDLWREILQKSEKTRVPALIHSDLGLVHRVLRDQLSDEFKAIRLDSEVEYAKVLDFVSRFQPSLVNRVRLHLRENAIFEEYGIQQEVDKAMRSKVWLKSGGYIVLNQTEALVAIDVNTGKFVGKSHRLEDTIVRTNLDAVHEIVRQVRLRNLGGIIVVDFIDMDERKSRQRVMQALEEELRKDRSPSKILQFNDFGLVAITRKRTQPSLERIMGTSCPRCGGAGFVKAIETVCYEIQQEVKKMLAEVEGDELTVRVSPDVAKALKSGEFVDFTELEEESKKDIRIQGDPVLVAEHFDIY